jgi:hypothetical protein
MASIVRELELGVSVEDAWLAVRDVGAVHTRLVPGLVREVRLDGGVRHVVFSSGLEIDELIVSVDEAQRRVVYAVQGRARHHQASMQVIGEGGHCRFIWITDLLPEDAADRFASMMDAALPIIKKTLETPRSSGADPLGR